MAVAAVAAARKAREEKARELQQQQLRDSHSQQSHSSKAASEDEEEIDSQADSFMANLPSPMRLHSPSNDAGPGVKPHGRWVTGEDSQREAEGPGGVEGSGVSLSRGTAKMDEKSAKVKHMVSFGSLAVAAKEAQEIKSTTSLNSILMAATACCRHEDARHKLARGESRIFRPPSRGLVPPYQQKVHHLYSAGSVQVLIAVLIFSNFVSEAVNAQVVPENGSRASQVFYGLEVFFNSIFTVELAANMYANWPTRFWKSAWNVFDFVIVLISWVSLQAPELPGISVLRLFRAFRVFRLFRRVESLRMIIEGVASAMPGVGNAFVILGILMGIWSIIGVEFFGIVDSLHFGTFLRAMFTMWQTMTGDDWSSLARSLLFDRELLIAAPYFVSFVFAASIVMSNVVIAILLDKYLRATTEMALMRTQRDNSRGKTTLRTRLWLLRKVLLEGKLRVAQQITAVRKLQRAMLRRIQTVRRRNEAPHRRAHKALSAVVSSTIVDAFSEQTLIQYGARNRMGILTSLWASQAGREYLQEQLNLRCTESHTLKFARMSASGALAHDVLLRVNSVRPRRP